MKIDNKLRPFMKEQVELLKQMEWEDQVNATLRKVYGEDKNQTGKQTVNKR